ncbi:23S rRNA pseudouridine(1911/1915/1917) synthase RluD [Coxiella endosymbiont of Amblyomma americanum]|uniref:23S rRNA pseudouridine(1911/1915/1917) synthase RluD n=1 Tax=Coxiella endosymbiont of Amblyomma americanum TaxID=325775 RepID=UPI00058002E1|nr:23S rRNA pseudouridine(1911/1915/1917) synthase RluD [Coxiella endosymbiont of Amblyomma americanum]AUJ58693.1 23S rRNA pseudouridine(1911/1915/1917) synthase [Coxiella-like endosymbiont of Amblyomma americanum]
MHFQKKYFKNIVPETLARIRLDKALAQLFPNFSRSQLQNYIRSGYVCVNGIKKIRTREIVKPNQFIEMTINQPINLNKQWIAQALPLNILYEDEALLIVNKPAGLTMHPGAGIPDCTLINALLHHNPKLAILPRAGIIHRLDKDTSGLLVVACSLISYHTLITAMKKRKITREYEAIVQGILISGQTINAPIGRHSVHRTRMTVVSNERGGREAITHFYIIRHYKKHTHLRIRLETGRTHQIRVHMAHIRHPLVGDPVYNSSRGKGDTLPCTGFRRQALHAATIKLSHPLTQKTMEWHSALPKDILNLLKFL